MQLIILRRAGLICLALLLLWLVLARGYADYLARVLPQRALVLNAGQSEALLVEAEAALREQRLDRAEQLARSALRTAPLSGPALRVLGAAAEARGDRGRARALISLGVAATPRDTAGQFWLAINALADKDLEGCLKRLDRLLRFEPEIEADAFPILATIAVSPAGVRAMAQTLAADPSWRREFVVQLVQQAPTAVDVLRLFREIRAAGGEVHETETDQLMRRLIAANDWKRMRRLLEVSTASTGTGTGLSNGDFNGPGPGPHLDWELGRVVGADVLIADDPRQPGNRALQLVFHDRRVPFQHVSHWLLLTPGAYRLAGRVRLVELQAARGLIWTISCAANGPAIAQSARLTGNRDWSEFSMDFTVPRENCSGQRLLLSVDARIAAEQQIAGEVWFDDIRIEVRLPAGNAGTETAPELETVIRSG
ncbi:MAG: tetratricopeptide repeat protein [Lysobacterales bacterium]